MPADGDTVALVETPAPGLRPTATRKRTDPFPGGGLCPPFHQDRTERGAGSRTAGDPLPTLAAVGHRCSLESAVVDCGRAWSGGALTRLSNFGNLSLDSNRTKARGLWIGVSSLLTD
jgi:hypothetical protein